MSLPLLSFPEEILHQVVLFLVDDADHGYNPYPFSLFHHASSDIFALSLVNRQVRRICLPFLFSYIKCQSCEELEKLERECLVNSAFPVFIRILDVRHIERIDANPSQYAIIRDTLVRLLPSLESLVWLELGTITMTSPLVTAIDTHPTLKTAAIFCLPRLPSRVPFPELPVNLDKLLLHGIGSADSEHLAIVQHRNIHVRSLYLDLSLPLIEARIPGLHELTLGDFGDTSDEQLDQFHAFVARHPSLATVNVNAIAQWSQCKTIRPHLSTFVQAVEAHSLNTSIDLLRITLESPTKSMKSDFKKGFDGWEVIKMTLRVISSFVETMSLTAAMFPKLVSLELTHTGSSVYVDSFLTLISKPFPTLQMLSLFMDPQSLIWTPLLTPRQRQSSDEKIDDATSRMRWLARQIFQASPSMINVKISQRPSQTAFWSVSASYRVKRDFFGGILGMNVESSVDILKTPFQKISFRGFVVM
ncbi:hypothetical protein C8J56DRAFT_933247 [Mycena floridula]|nr:hypothetical protein C8J56DRAFT_933247 [Mycena floridula]